MALDRAQQVGNQGPVVEAMRTGSVVTADPGGVAAWPSFTATAAPHRPGAGPWGSHPLRPQRPCFTDGSVELLQVFAALVGCGLAEYRAVTDARTLAAHLQEAMNTWAPIEQAKGMLMAAHHITAVCGQRSAC